MKIFRDILIESTLAVLTAAFVLLLSGSDPIECFGIMFRMTLRAKNIVNIIVGAAPVIITGIGISFAYRASLFNIGAEGQFIAAAAVSAVLGTVLDVSVISYPAVLLAGMAAGALYAGISGLLKARRGISEVISGIMLNWIAFHMSNYIVSVPSLHAENTLHTRMISASAMDPISRWKMSEEGFNRIIASPILRDTVGRTNANLGIVFAVLAALVCAYIMRRTTLGYRLRAVGLGAAAAELAGMDIKKSAVQSMMISGAVVGLAGALQTVGVMHYAATLSSFENYGFNGLCVALIARASPVGCIFAGLLFSALTFGGGMIQAFAGTPSEVISIMIGTIVFLAAVSPFISDLPARIAGAAGRAAKRPDEPVRGGGER